jgi:hypothetical protein
MSRASTAQYERSIKLARLQTRVWSMEKIY